MWFRKGDYLSSATGFLRIVCNFFTFWIGALCKCFRLIGKEFHANLCESPESLAQPRRWWRDTRFYSVSRPWEDSRFLLSLEDFYAPKMRHGLLVFIKSAYAKIPWKRIFIVKEERGKCLLFKHSANVSYLDFRTAYPELKESIPQQANCDFIWLSLSGIDSNPAEVKAEARGVLMLIG